jgi:signal transduction histidine kinase
VLILLRDADELVIAAAAGETDHSVGIRIPVAGSTSGQVLERGRPMRISNVSTELRISARELGLPEAQTALIVPMYYRGVAIGVLTAYDRGPKREPFTASDEQLLRTFAASAANAVAISRSVECDRLRSTIATAEAERRHWARELHDQTLQSLGALRVLLAGALRRGETEVLAAAVEQAVGDIESEIGNLRAIIADLRPMLLDDVGLRAAIEALVERRRGDDLEIACELELPEGRDDAGLIAPEIETTIYRLVQEALTNVVKHANATAVHVSVTLAGGWAKIEISDNGIGFDTEAPHAGFGLAGIHERVYLAGGEITIGSGAQGTVLHARVPVDRDQVAPRAFSRLAS